MTRWLRPLTSELALGRVSSEYVIGAPSPGTMSIYHRLCSLKNGENTPDNTDSDWGEQSALYTVAGSNDFIRNRVSNHENAFYLQTQPGAENANWGNPHGAAFHRICAGATPPGPFDGNVFHNNAGFGWYINTRFALKVQVDGHGRVADWGTCLPYL